MRNQHLLRHQISEYREELKRGQEASIASLMLGALREAERELAEIEKPRDHYRALH